VASWEWEWLLTLFFFLFVLGVHAPQIWGYLHLASSSFILCFSFFMFIKSFVFARRIRVGFLFLIHFVSVCYHGGGGVKNDVFGVRYFDFCIRFWVFSYVDQRVQRGVRLLISCSYFTDFRYGFRDERVHGN
jgi:hypothetical protein